MKTNLENDGNTVTIVDARFGGALATALATGNYTSLFIWDLTSSSYLNQADRNAVQTFYGVHNSIVLDSRSYGYHYQPNNASEVALLRNVANAFDARNGGIWMGTDHDSEWTRNVNPILSQLGFDTITGNHSEAVNAFDPASILLTGVTVTDLWAQGQSVGNVSLGIQPNGVDMRFHFGHSSSGSGAIPYISANFGDYVAPDEDPDDHLPPDPTGVPEPSSLALMLFGMMSVFGMKRIKAKSAR
ncbi:MAG: PEP-CTERM sorting domain-containing protein [Pseudomonadota bacterium]